MAGKQALDCKGGLSKKNVCIDEAHSVVCTLEICVECSGYDETSIVREADGAPAVSL